ncbi:MAG: AAA family ATPase [Candidatus Nanohaloarchaea archaeon]
MEIYGVTGMPLAGKTTVAEVMKEEGFTMLDMGDVVRIEMDKRGLDSAGDFVSSLRDEHGMDAIARLSTPYLREVVDEKDRVVITGMRSRHEKELFERELEKDIEIIGVWASRETRKRRKQERQREEDRETGLRDRDLRELKQGVGDLLALSDHMIENDSGSTNELEEEVKDIVRK